MNDAQIMLESIYFQEDIMNKIKSIPKAKIEKLKSSLKGIKTADKFKKLTSWVPRSGSMQVLNKTASRKIDGFSKRKALVSKSLSGNKVLSKVLDPLSTAIAAASKDDAQAKSMTKQMNGIRTANANVLINIAISVILFAIFSAAAGQPLVIYLVIFLVIDAILYMADLARPEPEEEYEEYDEDY